MRRKIAFAESGAPTITVGGEIIAFEPLPDAAANQTVPLGTSLDKLNLPETLTATVCVAAATAAEQFSLAPGGTYYFNLSVQGVSGPVNTALPDTSLKWVPFTYAGTVNAYSLDESSSGDKWASGNATASDRSLFVADYNISHTTVW